MAQWYVEQLGEPEGPYSPVQMRQLVAEGRISAQTRVRREQEDWYTADRIPGLLDATVAVAEPEPEGDQTGGLIPYKNPSALIAYYLGLFSLFPFLGSVLGIAAFILGIKGLRARRRNPEIKGSVHAWIGIIMGGGCGLLWTLMTILMIVVFAVEAATKG